MVEKMLRELEAAAQIVLAPPNLISSEQRQSAEAVFLNFHKTESPYQLCRQILELSSVDYVLFETAGLIKTAMIHEWSTLANSDISSLRQYLLQYVMSKPTLAPYVRARILQIFAITVKRGSVGDLGIERSRIINEIENLIKSENIPNQILGCDILSAILQEYAMTDKSSDICLTWEIHLKQKSDFEQNDIKRIFKFCIEFFSELIIKDFDESTLPLVKSLLSVVESILDWDFFGFREFDSICLYKFGLEAYEFGNDQRLKLKTQWQDVILDPAVLDLFFTLYWKVRSNPQLAHHAMNCLIQLAGVQNENQRKIEVQYLTNYMQRFLKLVSSIEIGNQEANGIITIIKNIICFYLNSLKNLPKDLFKLFMDQITRLTCLFIECDAQRESIRTDDCVYMENVFKIWSFILPTDTPLGSTTFILPPDFCEQNAYIQIFDTYLRCHLSPPEGVRNSWKSVSEEVADVKDNDQVKFKKQLKIIGNIGMRVPDHSVPLLTKLLEDRIHKLRDNLNILVEQNGSHPPSMDELFKDLHWLILISGHVLCMEGDISALRTSQMIHRNIKRIREGKVDVNRTLEFLMSSQNIQSDISSTDSIDQVVGLITGVFRLCTIEKTPMSIHLKNILSPELSSTIIWFLHGWVEICNLLTVEIFFELRPILHAFGLNSLGTLWLIDFLLEKAIWNINAFKSEAGLIDRTIKLLMSLANSYVMGLYFSKSEQFTSITELAMKCQYDFPQNIKRGLMYMVFRVGRTVEDTGYWLQILKSLQNRYVQLIYSDNFMSSYHEEPIRIQIIDLLESYIGVVQGAQCRIVTLVYQYTFPILAKLSKILSLYHNYQDIVQLILELFNEYTKLVQDSSDDDITSVHETCIQAMQTYVHCNSHRLTVDSTAEEDSFQDILLLVELLTNVLHDNKNIHFKSTEYLPISQLTISDAESIPCTDVFSFSLNIIVPMMAMNDHNLLKFPLICLKYFEMIKFVSERRPKKIFGLPVELLQQFLASVELGLHSFGNNVANLCCNTIQSLTTHIQNEVIQGQPRKDIMVPVLNLLMRLILSRQINSDLILEVSVTFYYLVCCYHEQYQQLVQNIVSTQTDPQVAKRLANAFTALTEDVDINFWLCTPVYVYPPTFRNKFSEFFMNVQRFLIVK